MKFNILSFGVFGIFAVLAMASPNEALEAGALEGRVSDVPI
jgi:hypothetical protein